MIAPSVLKRFLGRLPEFYKQEGTYNLEGFTEIGRLFYDNIDESGCFTYPDLEISTRGQHLEVDLLVTGYTNYKLGAILVQEEKNIDNIISEVKEAHQIDEAKSISLDRLAKIFDLSRGDWNDDEFRGFIKSAVTGLIGGGTSSNLKKALSLTIGIPEANVKITDSSLEAGRIIIEIPRKYENAKPELTTVISKYKPAGISFEPILFGEAGEWDTGKWDECVWV